ncbi:MAG: tetratricopeptide repeat protein [Leptospira sp.]|nr:tetratricopeptide repeat protein [Leptospira sp.]
MSSFQKNSLLTILLLAAVAYAPLYYSIQDAIKKESQPKAYNSPANIPKISFTTLSYNSSSGNELDIKALSALVNYEFRKMSGLVVLEENKSQSTDILSKADVIFSGSVQFEPEQILFTPSISFQKFHKTYTGSVLKVSWAEIGNAPILITKAYLNMLDEKIRLNRYLYLVPVWNPPQLDLNPDVLSASEYLVYKSSQSSDKTTLEKYNALNLLSKAKPKSKFLKYETLKLDLLLKPFSSYKDIWKEWNENKFDVSPFDYLLAYEIAESYMLANEESMAVDFFQIARKEREIQGHVYDLDYARCLSKIGIYLLKNGKKEEALFYLNSAKLMFETLQFENIKPFFENQFSYALLLAELEQKEVALNEFFKLEPHINNFNPFQKAVFYYNLAKLEYSMRVFHSAIYYAQKSRSILFEENLTNHDLNFSILNLLGASEFQLKNFNLAQGIWEEIVSAKSLLPIENKIYYRNALFNLSKVFIIKESKDISESYYKQYTRITPYSEIVSLDSNFELIVEGYLHPEFFIWPNADEFSELESNIIKSYTGRYVFSGQEEEIRARTYENRLEDTNEFLRDLMEKDFFGSPALAYLKTTVFPSNKSFDRGQNVIFIDIGPALNNPDVPGITSQSVAYHFPNMEVILWELPSEVELFVKKVPQEKKDSLFSFPNIRIISADGVGNFEDSYHDTKRWLFRNRNIPKLEGKTIIIRAANSIDIYETFDKIQPHFKEIGKYLKSNPVLYFFNRSILLKRPGVEKFTLIGYQSIRGFHHNFQSLDRNGEPPYTLAKYTLSDKH